MPEAYKQVSEKILNFLYPKPPVRKIYRQAACGTEYLKNFFKLAYEGDTNAIQEKKT